MRYNERTWSGAIISWIKEAISDGSTIFQDALNDAGIKLDSGKTKFPDILLFIDKVSGIVFNGWELKFPDTPVDDSEMLENALEKAKYLNSNSFVTWNGAEAIIWKINCNDYSLNGLEKLKTYPKEHGINSRDDLAILNNYIKHEDKLEKRLHEILHDLENLHINNTLRPAINISSNIIEAIKQTANKVIPQFKKTINELKGDNATFRHNFNQWKIIESSTLNILRSSSRRVETIEPEEILAKFMYYKLIAKTLFYQTLSENLPAEVNRITLNDSNELKANLEVFFNQAKNIDYQAVFEKDFTDIVSFTDIANDLIYELIAVFNKFDFKILPTEMIGYILENLVPSDEKQKFGQYFTSETLANLVTFSAIRTRNDILFDPTSGTGTFLNSFYNALRFLGNENHEQIISQIWGNDISHFPATLSVINLYKQKIKDTNNFPRVTRKDYFSLSPGQTISIPDNVDLNKINTIPIPQFDAIISNFPFIQQEDIPKEQLIDFFNKEFDKTQPSLIEDNLFKIDGKSDYYIYCLYNSLKFLKHEGTISIITSNAWLGKNYGIQFKKFLLDNFHIKYVVRSNAEHWFKDSKIKTIFFTLVKTKSNEPTKFITINNKLDDLFNKEILQQFEDFYIEVENCDNPIYDKWRKDTQFDSLYHKKDDTVSVSIVSNSKLIESLSTQENWSIYFIDENPLDSFSESLINPYPNIYDAGRGTRTGWDKMYIISNDENAKINIDSDFLLPTLKTSQELKSINYSDRTDYNFFVCNKDEEDLKANFPNTYKYIEKNKYASNNKNIKLPKVFKNNKPYWYSLSVEEPANIFISLNPSKKLVFSYSKTPILLNQRLVAIRVEDVKVELVAALLNSVVSLIIVELNGVSRYLGTLDLNADFFKTKMKILDPDLLTENEKNKIIEKFIPLSKREIKNYDCEFRQHDRISFDEEILKAYGYDIDILPELYNLLTELIHNRIEMKNR